MSAIGDQAPLFDPRLARLVLKAPPETNNVP